MNTRIRRTAIAVTAAVVLPFSLVACSSVDGDDAEDGAAETGQDTDTDDGMANASGPFGPACPGVPKDGAGCFDVLAQDPVATAASNHEALTTLVAAVDAAGLVDTLNSATDITVFAPVNDAFAAIPEEDLNAVLADQDQLTALLTYHVVGERLTPQQLANGSFETLQGGTLTTTGSDGSFTVNGAATVVCGNVQTANATVYLIDGVLMP